MNSPPRVVLLLSEFITGATMFQSFQPLQGVAAYYIVYVLDGAGKIRRAEWIEAASDRQALVRASRLPALLNDSAIGGCEVWQRDRRIGRVASRGRNGVTRSSIHENGCCTRGSRRSRSMSE
jgi:hypothetical protein